MPTIARCAASALALSVLVHAPASGQGVSSFETPDPALRLEGPARPGAFISVTGRRAAVFGDETGALELWAWPLKLVRDLELSFAIPEYDDPIPGARVATTVEVTPAATTVTYTHATFTVREHILVPRDERGGVILLDVRTVGPLEIRVGMHADFDLAWPGSFGGQYMTWDEDRRAFLLSEGGVHRFNAMVGSPFAVDGTTHPAHDAPTIPSRFTLRFDPARSTGDLIPIAFAGGAISADSVAGIYERLLTGAPAYWRESAGHYRGVLSGGPTLRSPEPWLDAAYDWARVNLDQQLVCNPGLGCGLVAGFGRAGAGNFRPGFGWYFGGDAAINSFAMDGTGQLAMVRAGLEFLARYQRADGKIPHEISHAAPWLPWFSDYPYTWYHGDTTPYWIVACSEYWRASGDTGFLRSEWAAIERAFEWSRNTDADGDGLMENPAAGAGAIEVGGLGESLHTDIYLAGMWTVALGGVRDMARAVGRDSLAAVADRLQERALATIERQFWLGDEGIYAFALLEPGEESAEGTRAAAEGDLRVNAAVTVWPATVMSFGLLDPARADRMLARLAAADVTTDWGTRLLSAEHPLYQPLHYNNGAVWPFMTGFTALAHYRYHRSWEGYELLRDIARTTFDFARGRNPELLSGAFYRTLDTTVPQQFFATSMLVTPLVRGLLGVTQDAPHAALELAPHLPADWDSLQVSGVVVGRDTVDLSIRRGHGTYCIHLARRGPVRPLHVRVAPALPLGSRVTRATVNDRDADVQVEASPHDVHAGVELPLDDEALVELEYDGGVEIVPPREPLRVGDAPHGLRILDFRRDGPDYVLRLQAPAGSVHEVELRTDRVRRLRGAEVAGAESGVAHLRVRFPGAPGEGYVDAEVRFQRLTAATPPRPWSRTPSAKGRRRPRPPAPAAAPWTRSSGSACHGR